MASFALRIAAVNCEVSAAISLQSRDVWLGCEPWAWQYKRGLSLDLSLSPLARFFFCFLGLPLPLRSSTRPSHWLKALGSKHSECGAGGAMRRGPAP